MEYLEGQRRRDMELQTVIEQGRLEMIAKGGLIAARTCRSMLASHG